MAALPNDSIAPVASKTAKSMVQHCGGVEWKIRLTSADRNRRQRLVTTILLFSPLSCGANPID